MRPLTHTRPKVMLPVAGKPILEHLVTQCRKAGLSDFVFIVGYHDEAIRSYFGNGTQWDVHIRYAMQRQAHGTADALRQAQGLIDAPFLLLNGDIMLKSEDIAGLKHTPVPAMSLIELADVTGMGVVELAGSCVRRLYEKSPNPPTRLANAGAYHFTQGIFSAIEAIQPSSRGEYEITDAIQLLIDTGMEVSYRFVSTWRDIGYPWDLLTINEELLKSIDSTQEGIIEAGAVLKGSVIVGRNSLIRSGSYITGPVVVGKNCDIGPNCYIRPYTAIGDRCHIGNGVEIKNSVIMSGTNIPHLSYVGDSVIGEGCNLGAGTQVANLRFNGGGVRVDYHDTGRRKLGVIMGDGVFTGVNSSINPGTIIGCGARIGPGALASGVIAAGAGLF